MEKFCGNCEKMCEVVESKEVREYEIKKTKVSAEITILTCKNCGEEVFDKDVEIANDILLFDDYKRKNSLLTANEIAKIREKYKISQATLSKILGFGIKTITRYENGTIQDNTHDNLLRLINKEENFFELWYLNKDRLSDSENAKIEKTLKKEVLKTEYEYQEPCSKLYNTKIGRKGELIYGEC